MIVDASAIVAIVRDEPEGDGFASVISEASWAGLSAATLLEACILIDRQRSAEVSERVSKIIDFLQLEILPFTPEQARIARDAYRRFGKGMAHPAKLNFGDCMAYATAVERNAPLLFKGNDFSKTDVRPA